MKVHKYTDLYTFGCTRMYVFLAALTNSEITKRISYRNCINIPDTEENLISIVNCLFSHKRGDKYFIILIHF